jgi:exodeoxyribonuclease VII small subunit
MQNITDEAISKLSFEEALTRLETLVNSLERENLTLDEAVAIFEIGNKLKVYCEGKLAEAKLKIEKVIQSAQGNTTVEAVEAM